MIFISETNLGYDSLPSFEDFTTVADPSKKTCTYGGIAWYVKNSLAKHMFQVQFNKAYISFRLRSISYPFASYFIQFSCLLLALVGYKSTSFPRPGLIKGINQIRVSELNSYSKTSFSIGRTNHIAT